MIRYKQYVHAGFEGGYDGLWFRIRQTIPRLYFCEYFVYLLNVFGCQESLLYNKMKNIHFLWYL